MLIRLQRLQGKGGVAGLRVCTGVDERVVGELIVREMLAPKGWVSGNHWESQGITGNDGNRQEGTVAAMGRDNRVTTGFTLTMCLLLISATPSQTSFSSQANN